uniref:Replicative DNA helicase n=1 Tax=Titanophycus setchellii TaxID=940129 RepID=A0A1G4NYS9_9FLOR|nr:Replication helicase subunit [Titanophycus setchellii]SCW23676.1 Replication helicase subunit [Titanophycus setchellii]
MINQGSLLKYHEQLPPQNNLAEEIVLGGILVNTEIMQLAINELVTESFCLETHQIIYRTIVEIYLKKDYIDSIILINTLWDLNLLNIIGGVNKILNLLKHAQVFISQEPTYSISQYYIQIIKEKYIRRLLIQHGYNIIKLAYISSIPPRTLLIKTNKYLEHINSQYNHKTDDRASSLLSNLLLKLKGEYPTQKYTKIMSGFTNLDKISHGFREGDLIVVAGRPSMGKTSFSLNIAVNLIRKHTESICIFSLEMSREQILYKLLSILAQIPISKLQSAQISAMDWTKVQQAANQLVKSQIHINDNANMSLSNLITTAKTLKHTYKDIQLIIIDYLQLIQFNNPKLSNRNEELSSITRSLKVLAKELCLPIIILSQLNRNVENRVNKRPLLSDLRESGCIGYHNKITKTSYKIIIKNNSCNRIRQSKTNTRDINYQTYHSSFQIQQTQTKHGYCLNNVKQYPCTLTHNHMFLTNQGWQKTDQIKQATLVKYTKPYLKKISHIDKKLYIQANFQTSIMYDLIIHDTKSFRCNSQYILHNSIEQDADLVLMLYRESYYHNTNTDVETIQMTNLIIAKHRNGPTGNIELQFNPTFSSFENI